MERMNEVIPLAQPVHPFHTKYSWKHLSSFPRLEFDSPLVLLRIRCIDFKSPQATDLALEPPWLAFVGADVLTVLCDSFSREQNV